MCNSTTAESAGWGARASESRFVIRAMIKINALVMGSSNKETREFKQNSLSLASFTFQLTLKQSDP